MTESPAAGPEAIRESVLEGLRAVLDPELGLSIVELGLVYEVEATPDAVHVVMTMTTPACVLGEHLRAQAEQVCRSCSPPGTRVSVELVWEPPWHPGLMSEAARRALGW